MIYILLIETYTFFCQDAVICETTIDGNKQILNCEGNFFLNVKENSIFRRFFQIISPGSFNLSRVINSIALIAIYSRVTSFTFAQIIINPT